MNQSGFLAAALIGGFVLFVAARGNLAAYSKTLFGPAPPLGPFVGIPIATAGTASGKGGGGVPGLPAAPAGGGGASSGLTLDQVMADALKMAPEIAMAF
jgi:hypothetical protein